MRNEEVKAGSKWQHFKGDVMTVLELAKHSENLEEMVVYEHKGEIWVRPISSFLSEEDISNREDNKTGQKYRFEKIKESLDEGN